jgi:hypothetical protein
MVLKADEKICDIVEAVLMEDHMNWEFLWGTIFFHINQEK